MTDIKKENIKNIIFDLGRVLINFQPLEYIEAEIPAEKMEAFNSEVFESPEWLMLDRGTLSYEEAKKIFKERIPEAKEEIDRLFDGGIYDMLKPIEENTVLLPKLKGKYRLYILSNFHKNSYEELRRRYNFFGNFDGDVVSCYYQLLKPERKIYETILEKYGLIPEETVFIDDTKVNIEAAEKLGIKGMYLPDYTKLKEKLEVLF